MKLLIVDNNLHINQYPQGLIVKLALDLKTALNTVVKKPDRLTKKDLKVDKVILTGSAAYVRQETGWMKKEKEFIDIWMKKKIPILGVCFGAQLLAIYLFGKNSVEAMPVPINGSILFHRKKDPLFKGLPNSFGVVSTHYEGVKLPKKYVIGSVDEWYWYAFKYKTAYGIQFHPELMGHVGRTLVKIQTLIYDKNVYQDFSVPSKGTYGKKIFKNFIESI